jgi:hypothetical protein
VVSYEFTLRLLTVGEPFREFRRMKPLGAELATRPRPRQFPGYTGELGNLQYRANPRNFRKPMAGKELTNGQRRFEGSFWLPGQNSKLRPIG